MIIWGFEGHQPQRDGVGLLVMSPTRELAQQIEVHHTWGPCEWWVSPWLCYTGCFGAYRSYDKALWRLLLNCLRCHGMFAVYCNDCDSWNRVSKWFWWHCGGGKQTWNGIKHWLDLKRSLVYILSVAAYCIDPRMMEESGTCMYEMHVQFVGSQNLSFRPSWLASCGRKHGMVSRIPGLLRWRPIALENVWVCHLFLGLTDLGDSPSPKSCKMCFEIDCFHFLSIEKWCDP